MRLQEQARRRGSRRSRLREGCGRYPFARIRRPFSRSQSLFGLADVKCYFRWGTTYEQARQEVLNRLNMIQLPEGVQATISEEMIPNEAPK